MIEFGVEGFDQARSEIEGLISLHYEEIDRGKHDHRANRGGNLGFRQKGSP